MPQASTKGMGSITRIDASTLVGRWSDIDPSHATYSLEAGDGTYLFCRNCGKYGQQRVLRLKDKCVGHPSSSSALDRLKRMIKMQQPVRKAAKVL